MNEELFFELPPDHFKRIRLQPGEHVLSIDVVIYDDLGCIKEQRTQAIESADVHKVEVQETGVRITLKSSRIKAYF